MSLKNNVVVIAGATGDVGSGATRAFLNAGATVLGISRSHAKLDALRAELGIGASDRFIGVEGDFRDDADAVRSRDAVREALGDRAIDHVVSGVGFITFAQAATVTPIGLVRQSLEDGLFNTIHVAQAFLPELKKRPGSSYTMVSGGLAHGLPPFVPNVQNMWLAALKNGAVNALTHGLAAESLQDEVRVNTLCIHFGVARIGKNTNHFGMATEKDTLALGAAFVGVAHGQQRGEVICLGTWDDVTRLA